MALRARGSGSISGGIVGVGVRSHRRRGIAASILLLLAGFAPAATRAADPVQIRVLSNRADLVSGGDALVEVVLPAGADAGAVTVTLGTSIITGSFAVRADGRFYGLVTGLADGANLLTAQLPDGTGATLTITNHPIGGPVFSGEQVQPWLCTTQSNGLGQATDSQCNAPTKTELFYRSTNPTRTGFPSYNQASPPSDVATTTTDEGVTVPYIVRRERGTANRGIYDIAVLFDPSQPWEPWAPQEAWNHKIFYIFGASCGTVHSQSSPSGALNDMALSRGFMVVNSSLNNLGNNCNTVTSAESAMMLKERVVEGYGFIRYTIGQGCSGGSIGQQMVSNAYPGLVDGIQPNCSFEDTWSTGLEVVDCHLLVNYFNKNPALWAAAEQWAFVSGHMSPSSCVAWDVLFAPVADPHQGCNVPGDDYDETTNADGCRGTLADYMVGVVGRRPQDGFANLAFDNVGVQYGLNALNSGLIAAEQFVDLNEKIGAIDIDFKLTTSRREADPTSLHTLYGSGQINDGRQLDKVAMVDLRGTSNNEIHTDFHTYSMRARLDRANGHHDNHLIWSSHVPLVGDPVWTLETFLLLDRWLAAVEADTSDAPREAKIVRNKPVDAVDACWAAGRRITDMNVCRPAFPYFGAPRIAAGGPVTHDIGKCQLSPLDPADYTVEFTDGQWARLLAAFPSGVCDWSKPGVDQVPSRPWVTFANGPGGVPLGDPPVSEPL